MEKIITIKLDLDNFYKVWKSIDTKVYNQLLKDNPAINQWYCETLSQVRQQAHEEEENAK